jgi:uncharacterized membrane protein YphA (DoxX/SURF4 family)
MALIYGTVAAIMVVAGFFPLPLAIFAGAFCLFFFLIAALKQWEEDEKDSKPKAEPLGD